MDIGSSRLVKGFSKATLQNSINLALWHIEILSNAILFNRKICPSEAFEMRELGGQTTPMTTNPETKKDLAKMLKHSARGIEEGVLNSICLVMHNDNKRVVMECWYFLISDLEDEFQSHSQRFSLRPADGIVEEIRGILGNIVKVSEQLPVLQHNTQFEMLLLCDSQPQNNSSLARPLSTMFETIWQRTACETCSRRATAADNGTPAGATTSAASTASSKEQIIFLSKFFTGVHAVEVFVKYVEPSAPPAPAAD